MPTQKTDSFIIEPIKCGFRKIPNYPEEGLKAGRYSGSFHWEVKDFAYKKWVVLGYLDVDWVELEKQGKSQAEILLGCLQHLNIVPEAKKGSKKEPKPKYGLLEPYKADFKLGRKDNEKPFIIVQFKTNEQSNPHFWSSGPSWNGKSVSTKKRGRPPKVKIEEQIEQ